MKKLLALILCVMMFVSVLSTSAFAVYPFVDDPLANSNTYAREIKNMIKNTKDNIKNAYGVLIMDESVYTSAKFMDDTIVNLVDALAKDLIGKTIVANTGAAVVPHTVTKADVDYLKNAVRGLFDGMVHDEIADNQYKFWDGSDLDPIKYAQVVADAVATTFTDKDFQKGYEAVATWFAVTKLLDDVADELHDQYVDYFDAVAGSGFDNNFAARYPQLAADYMDSIAGLASTIAGTPTEALGIYDTTGTQITAVAPWAFDTDFYNIFEDLLAN